MNLRVVDSKKELKCSLYLNIELKYKAKVGLHLL